MRKLSLLLSLLLYSGLCYGQGALYRAEARSVSGPAIPGAQIYVCTSTAPLTPAPCQSNGGTEASVYSDIGLSVPITQPVVADGYGNYQFYVGAGNYVVSVTGAGVVPISFNMQAAGVGTGCNPTGPTNSLQKTNGGACAASAIVDNGTTITASEPVVVPSVNQVIQIDGNIYPRSVAGINSAIRTVCTTYPGSSTEVLLTPGTYADDGTTTINVPCAGVHIEGSGTYATNIIIAASRTATLFNFGITSNENGGNSLGGILIDATAASAGSAKSPLIVLTDLDMFRLHDLKVLFWNGTGATSIVVDSKGRDLGDWNNLYLSGDQPVQIDQDPSSTICFDQMHWDNVLLAAQTTGGSVANPGVKMNTGGCQVTHWLWTEGIVGPASKVIDWNETTTGGHAASDITFINVHHEQGTGGGLYSFDFQRSAGAAILNNFVCITCTADSSQNGFRFQQSNNVTLVNPTETGGGSTPLSVDNTNSNFNLVNAHFTNTLSGVAPISGPGNILLNHLNVYDGFSIFGYSDLGTTQKFKLDAFSGILHGTQEISDQGTVCTNAELALSGGWQSTGSATVTAVAGTGQTCSWTITTGTTTAANPTVTDTLTNSLPSAATVCELNIHGGTHTAVAGEGFTQTTLSATAPVFTFIGTPGASGVTYFVTRRCGP